MTHRTKWTLAVLIAAIHFALVVGSVIGTVALSMKRIDSGVPGFFERLLVQASDVLLMPAALVWEPNADAPGLIGLVILVANSVVWGGLTVLAFVVIQRARGQRAAL